MRAKGDAPFWSIFFRYVILVLVPISNLWIIYLIFTPLTIYPSYFILKFLFDTVLIGNSTFLVNGKIPIDLIKSCIAGAAYYLLLILNLTVPRIPLKRRLLMIGISFLSLLIVNTVRVIILTGIYVVNNSAFEVVHIIFWYIMSTIFIVAIWFAEVKIFKIKDIPIYSDIKFLFKHAIGSK